MAATDSDWHRQPVERLERFAMGLLVALAAVYAYHGWTTRSYGYVSLALLLLATVVVFRTNYWDPVLFLVVAGGLSVESVRSILNGAWRHLPVSIAIVLGLAFVFLAVYLFFRAQRAGEPASGR